MTPDVCCSHTCTLQSPQPGQSIAGYTRSHTLRGDDGAVWGINVCLTELRWDWPWSNTSLTQTDGWAAGLFKSLLSLPLLLLPRLVDTEGSDFSFSISTNILILPLCAGWKYGCTKYKYRAVESSAIINKVFQHFLFIYSCKPHFFLSKEDHLTALLTQNMKLHLKYPIFSGGEPLFNYLSYHSCMTWIAIAFRFN